MSHLGVSHAHTQEDRCLLQEEEMEFSTLQIENIGSVGRKGRKSYLIFISSILFLFKGTDFISIIVKNQDCSSVASLVN